MRSYVLPGEDPAMESFDNCPDFLEQYLSHLHHFSGKAPSSVVTHYNILQEYCRYIHYCAKIGESPASKDAHRDIDISIMPIEEICAVTEQQILDYLDFADITLSNANSTIYKKLSYIRQLYKFLQQNASDLGIQLPNGNPCQNIRGPTGSVRPATALSMAQVAKLADGVTGVTALRDKAIILLLATSGLQLSELVMLDRRDICANSVRIRSKGVRRELTVPDSTTTALRSYMLTAPGQSDHHPLFQASDFPRRLTAREISYRVAHAAKTAGMAHLHITPKILRETAVATALLRCHPADYRRMLRYLGYSSDRAFSRFQHLLKPEEQADMSDTIREAFRDLEVNP